MKKLLLVYIVCYLFCGAKAQNEPIGSTKDFKYIKQNALKPHIKLDPNRIDTLLVLSLIEKGNRNGINGSSDSTIRLFERALNYSKIIKYTYGQAASFKGLGKVSVVHGLNRLNSLNQTRRAITLFKKLQHKSMLAECYLDLSLFYAKETQADSALELVYRGLSLLEKKDFYRRGRASYILAIIFNQIDQKDKEFKQLKTAEFYLSLDSIGKRTNLRAFIYLLLGKYYTLMANDSALYYLNKGQTLCKLSGSYRTLAESYMQMAQYHNNQKNWPLVISCLQDALKVYEIIAYNDGLCIAHLYLGEAYTEIGEYQKALIHLKKALYIATKIKDVGHTKESFELLSTLYEKMNAYRESLGYYKSFISYRDSAKESYTENERLKANLTADFKNKELRLKEEALVKDLQNEIKINKQSKYYLVIVFTLCLTILLVTLLAIRKNLKQKILANKQIAAMQAEKYKLSLEIQESERRVIAREIHDSAGALISAIKYSLANCLVLSNQQILTEKLEANISHAGKLGDELRNISHRMMPIVLIEDGLGNAISYLLDSLLRLNDIKYEFENEVGTKRFEEQIEITLYRITEELLSNILKHSQSKNVAVILYQSKNNLVLTMEDDGIGFNPQVKKGLGLTSIDLRLTAVRGKISFENKVTAGVLTTINIPLITANTVS